MNDIAIKRCNISSGATVEVKEWLRGFCMMAESIGDSIAWICFIGMIWLVGIIVGIEGSFSPWARRWLNDVE